jgi:hypothetical protein
MVFAGRAKDSPIDLDVPNDWPSMDATSESALRNAARTIATSTTTMAWPADAVRRPSTSSGERREVIDQNRK